MTPARPDFASEGAGCLEVAVLGGKLNLFADEALEGDEV